MRVYELARKLGVESKEALAALNDLGLTSRDVIGIFQAIDRAGALQGELVIL